MAEKYGVATNQNMENLRECTSYKEAVSLAAGGTLIVVWYAHGQWWY